MENKSRIADWLKDAATQLKACGINSSRLDAEIILAHTLRKNRSWLHAHAEQIMDSRQIEIANARLDLRLDRVPIAYIIGHKEFFGRQFIVSTATLIPRPESEILIELLKQLPLPQKASLVDVGTGSGCLGISAKLEIPNLDVTLIDISVHALKIAERNAKKLQAEVNFLRSNLLYDYPFSADVILANLPYVSPDWQQSPELKYEPSSALFAKNDGLDLVFKLIETAPAKLKPGGYLLLEADPRQHHALINYAQKFKFSLLQSQAFALVFRLER